MSWRFLLHPPADGAWNMAVDEALLRSCSEGASGPVLRLYGWAPPSLSLGAHQPVETAADREWLRERGYDLVRRPTGGRAVLHADEVTYAVAAPLTGGPAGPFEGQGIQEVYRRIAEGLHAGFLRLGIEAELVRGAARRDREAERRPDPCFTSPSRYELLWDGRKIAGSAQRRLPGAFLQHGSLPLRADEEGAMAATGRTGLPPGWMAGLEEAAGRVLEPDEIAGALRAGFEEAFGTALEEQGLSVEESRLAMELREGKYATDAWNLRREDPLRAPAGGAG
jgi:lipoate-protein ligase A